MTKIAIKVIMSSQTPPKPSAKPEYSHRVQIFEKVQHYIGQLEDAVDDSGMAWAYCKAMFLKLHMKPVLSHLEKDLMSILEPVVLKYAQDDPTLAAKIEGYKLNKHKHSDLDYPEEYSEE